MIEYLRAFIASPYYWVLVVIPVWLWVGLDLVKYVAARRDKS